jgi:hypothetical protein
MQMRLKATLGLATAFISSAALATAYPTLNVMLQFTCLSLNPPAYTGDSAGPLRPSPQLRTERSIGGTRAIHRILLSGTHHILIEEALESREECLRGPQDAITWTSSRNGGWTTEFCITANPPMFESDVIVRVAIPNLETDYDRRVVEDLHMIATCRIERGPFRLFPGDRFVVGRALFVPRVEAPVP